MPYTSVEGIQLVQEGQPLLLFFPFLLSFFLPYTLQCKQLTKKLFWFCACSLAVDFNYHC